MAEYLDKLRPDRDLQCYFERPSAIAAMSGASASGFTLSGSWRQQFDWAVVEWNRDNPIDHPLFRNLPDGALSGLLLSYDEVRVNCIPADSTLFPTVDWHTLRIWVEDGLTETVHKVHLNPIPREGAYVPAQATFTLGGTVTAGDYVEVAWQNEHYTIQVSSSDTLESVVDSLAAAVNAGAGEMYAEAAGSSLTLYHVGIGATVATSTTGHNGNRLGVYANVAGAKTQSWSHDWQKLSGGVSPHKWGFEIDFSNLVDESMNLVPAEKIRKLRWTYAADMQAGAYERSEFAVQVTNWSVAGLNTRHKVAGPGSFRIEDDSTEIVYSGDWSTERGNYSGGSIHYSWSANAAATVRYSFPREHLLFLGTRRLLNGCPAAVTVDGGTPEPRSLALPGEDILVRLPLGGRSAGNHTVEFRHLGTAQDVLYFDFLEIVIPSEDLPGVAEDARVTLATDWDTDHSLSISAERTAWILSSLGFRGRANHYVGALWFYELVRQGHAYAAATVTFNGTPVFSQTTTLAIGVGGGAGTPITHLNLIGDTAESVCRAFELVLNNGFTAVWASASGTELTIHARQMGEAGNELSLEVSPSSGAFYGIVTGREESGQYFLDGGADGEWRTDLESMPRLNRAARDWSRAYFTALRAEGIECTAAFSTELQHGDPSLEVGIVQRYPSGNPVVLNTPAIQTNFSPTSLAYWKDVHLGTAALMAEAGVPVYLQLGEVQWWYFPYDESGMPFYDAYSVAQFEIQYGRPMHVFTSNNDDPAPHVEEVAFLRGQLGWFTTQIIEYVRSYYPAAQFEVLYPPDVNDFRLTRLVNLPGEWNPDVLDHLKTENFSFTFARDLNKAQESMNVPLGLDFPVTRTSHLVGIQDYTSPWLKEIRLAKASGKDSIVIWALDQFCLIGYPAPLPSLDRRSRFLG